MRHPPVSAAARRLAARLEPRVNELARRMARESFEQVPGYAALPDDMKDVEIAATARFGMRQFLRGIRDGHVRAGTGGDMLFLERAAQRADEGLPLHLLVRSHALGTYVLWQALREAARPGEEEALAELVDQLLSVGPAVLGSIVRTYLDERHAVHAEEHAQRRALAGSLLDGRLPADEPQLVRMGLDGRPSCWRWTRRQRETRGRWRRGDSSAVSSQPWTRPSRRAPSSSWTRQAAAR
ncbi:hypothetical protein LUX33_36685 [Actinomadura madurae]|uniref:hypothetical protein n=1 Tax=Actinomadura madurae TaxID=1993 RepID=UPI0020D2401C|nr:hypothetical protein [Actinomadura madurae]MCP9953431.1 hypothetical protein [Actinomadura madurae]MCP9970193.1 hypothetical protein [Actinomadura madurae]